MLLLCRNGLIALAAITVIVQGAVFPADAQSIKRIETLWATTHEAAAPYVRALEEGLASYGWLAGKNLVIRHNFTNAQPEKLDHYAAEIVARKPDLIWASLNTAALALKRQTATVPIVIGNAVDPVGVGLAESFNRPGGNITGVAVSELPVYAKSIQLLRQVLPGVRSVGFVYNADFPGLQSAIDIADQAARDMGLHVIRVGLNGPGEIQAAIARLIREGAQSLYIMSDNLTFLQRNEIGELALAARLPTISQLREFCEAGMLVCYSTSLKAKFRRSAFMVDRILKGERPGDIPLEQASYFEFVVNMRTAQKLGVEFDRAILSQVDDIIE